MQCTAHTHIHHAECKYDYDDDEAETEAGNVCVLCFFFLETSSADVS